jgi:hypothetical protein
MCYDTDKESVNIPCEKRVLTLFCMKKQECLLNFWVCLGKASCRIAFCSGQYKNSIPFCSLTSLTKFL